MPETVKVCFTNTGAEREETLRFVKNCSDHWNVPVVWLEYRHRPNARGRAKGHWKHVHEIVTFETASRKYEPYESMIMSRSMLPNIADSFCTSVMKVNPVNWYCRRDLGWKQFHNILGMRADEANRVYKALMTECTSEYPMFHAKVTKRDVLDFWKDQSFDLGITSDQGNCDLCFKKGRAKLVRLIRDNPELADWWIEMENRIEKNPKVINRGLVKPEMARFRSRDSYVELREEALNPPMRDLFDDEPEPDVDCFCGFDES